jgi:hypothetical protein
MTSPSDSRLSSDLLYVQLEQTMTHERTSLRLGFNSLVAFGSPDCFVISTKVYASKLNLTYQTFGTVTTPAAETKSIDLRRTDAVYILKRLNFKTNCRFSVKQFYESQKV